MKITCCSRKSVVAWSALAYSAAMLVSSPTRAQEPTRSQQLVDLFATVETAAQNGSEAAAADGEMPSVTRASDGSVRFLAVPPGQYFPVITGMQRDDDKMALVFLREHGRLFGVESEAVDFEVVKTRGDGNRTFVRLQQTYAGIPVFAAQIIVQLKANAGVECVICDIARDTRSLENKSFALVPSLDSKKAIAAARDLLLAQNPAAEVATTDPQRLIFDPSVVGGIGEAQLVWSVTVHSEDAPELGRRFLLDAHKGDVVRAYPLAKNVLNRRVFDSNNTTHDPGTLEREEGGAVAGITEVDNAYDYLGDTYDFYSTVNGRDGINASGMTLSVTVRYCKQTWNCPYGNAYWASNNRIYFGDNFVTDDIVAHEYTHGVTDFESNLVYENHSGAIDESLSDVWGEFVDLGNGAGLDTAAVRWLLGEDLPGIPNGAIRNMSDPPAMGDPDRLQHPSFVQPVAFPDRTNDYGGVHTNSGVNNKLCYLLTDGDTFNGQTVTGMGIQSVAQLYYEAATNLLTSGADYTDLGNALQQAARNTGLPHQLRNNVQRACWAVEIADAGNDVHIDGAYNGPELGTEAFPFNTVGEGHSNAYPGDRLLIKAGSYRESLILNKTVYVVAINGVVTIGE